MGNVVRIESRQGVEAHHIQLLPKERLLPLKSQRGIMSEIDLERENITVRDYGPVKNK